MLIGINCTGHLLSDELTDEGLLVGAEVRCWRVPRLPPDADGYEVYRVSDADWLEALDAGEADTVVARGAFVTAVVLPRVS